MRYPTKAAWAQAKAEHFDRLASDQRGARFEGHYSDRSYARHKAAPRALQAEADRYRRMAERFRRKGM